jgi:hypothetical protein
LAHRLTANSNSSKLPNHDPRLILKKKNLFEPFPLSFTSLQTHWSFNRANLTIKTLYSYFALTLVSGPFKCPYTLALAFSMIESWYISLPSGWKWFVLKSESSTSSK